MPSGEFKKKTWFYDKDNWYYLDDKGNAVIGWKWISGKCYYFDKNGAMAKGAIEAESSWVKVNGKWKYWLPSGEFKKKTWFYDKDNWYYLDDKGNAVIGWKWISGKCYYFDKNGAMAADVWIGDFYVDSSGAWVQNAKNHVGSNRGTSGGIVIQMEVIPSLYGNILTENGIILTQRDGCRRAG